MKRFIGLLRFSSRRSYHQAKRGRYNRALGLRLLGCTLVLLLQDTRLINRERGAGLPTAPPHTTCGSAPGGSPSVTRTDHCISQGDGSLRTGGCWAPMLSSGDSVGAYDMRYLPWWTSYRPRTPSPSHRSSLGLENEARPPLVASSRGTRTTKRLLSSYGIWV